jgi:hypothetical protein
MSSPYSAAVPGQCRWRPEGRRDLVRATARAASTPTVAMATTPPPAPTRGPATHEGVSRTPSLSHALDKIRQPRPNLCGSDREYNNSDGGALEVRVLVFKGGSGEELR